MIGAGWYGGRPRFSGRHVEPLANAVSVIRAGNSFLAFVLDDNIPVSSRRRWRIGDANERSVRRYGDGAPGDFSAT